MPLLGATIGVNQAFMEALVEGADVIDVYSGNSDAKVTTSCNIATDEFRSAAIKGGYSSTDIDALTSSTIPARWQKNIGYLALDELTSGGMARPDSIGEKAAQVRKSLSYLAGGSETIDGLTRGGTTGGPAARVGSPASRRFDFDDTTSGSAYYRHTKL